MSNYKTYNMVSFDLELYLILQWVVDIKCRLELGFGDCLIDTFVGWKVCVRFTNQFDNNGKCATIISKNYGTGW